MNRKIFRELRDPAYNELLDRMKAYDTADHDKLVHVRLDNYTVVILNQLKLATGIDITKVMAFAVSELLKTHPELRLAIDQFLNQLKT
ncbi:hypothetical protein [Mucilaginibacter aquariorum]|uniref:Uncharacterized protein n=1 Tax=Mucilaginibacter aquariorum TaxID=2967225 RepID=A0ABT1SZ62_9SPHI|nr:hypothetical protein [Mucilaginibacter aquariorum]MCQ6957641.1 hypothetical protein [Mucilaginibacter aquariorum]